MWGDTQTSGLVCSGVFEIFGACRGRSDLLQKPAMIANEPFEMRLHRHTQFRRVFHIQIVIHQPSVVFDLAWEAHYGLKPSLDLFVSHHLNPLSRLRHNKIDRCSRHTPVDQGACSVEVMKQPGFQNSDMAGHFHRPGENPSHFPDIDLPVGDDVRARRSQVAANPLADAIARLPDIDRDTIEIAKRINPPILVVNVPTVVWRNASAAGLAATLPGKRVSPLDGLR